MTREPDFPIGVFNVVLKDDLKKHKKISVTTGNTKDTGSMKLHPLATTLEY